MKYRSHRYDINRPRLRHEHKDTKYKCDIVQRWLFVVSNTYATCEAQFIKKQATLRLS